MCWDTRAIRTDSDENVEKDEPQRGRQLLTRHQTYSNQSCSIESRGDTLSSFLSSGLIAMNDILTRSELAPKTIFSRLSTNYSIARLYPEVEDAKRLWNVIAFIIAVDALWAYLTGFKISTGWVFPVALLIFIAIKHFFTAVWPSRRTAAFFETFVQYITFGNAAVFLSYLFAASGFPLVDKQLAAMDAALGFDWLAFFNWSEFERPLVGGALNLIYASAIIQVVVLLVTLSVTARFARMTEFTWLIVISLLIILPLSLFLPAEGAWAHYGVAHLTSAYYLPDFYALRSGAKRAIDLNENLNGIIQFPSYHAALGLMLIISSRGTFLFSVYLPLNILMIVSALTAGGHHLVDLIFGLATVPMAALVLKTIRSAEAIPVEQDAKERACRS